MQLIYHAITLHGTTIPHTYSYLICSVLFVIDVVALLFFIQLVKFGIVYIWLGL